MQPLDWLFLAVPLAFAIRYVPAWKNGTLLFIITGLAIIPLAGWMGRATEHLGVRAGHGIGGLLNIIAICGRVGIFISKDSTKDIIWPDMIWPWIIAYDLWNFAYTYNCIADHSFYAGLALLLACTIPAFFIKKGAWLQHRAQTLALWIMFVMTIPSFADRIAPVPTTHNPTAFFIVSLLALVANIGLVVYQFSRVRKYKLNPLKDEIFVNTKAYQTVIEQNR